MNADASDVTRALAAIGAPAMAYRRFAAADVPTGETTIAIAPAPEAGPFPLLAACLPECADLMPDERGGPVSPAVPATPPIAAAPAWKPATPCAPPPPAAVAVAQAATTPLVRVFRALHGRAPGAAPSAAPSGGLQDLFRRL
jgi:hypothetical protein